MKCEFCGKELVDDAVFCNHCGKKVETADCNIAYQYDNDIDSQKEIDMFQSLVVTENVDDVEEGGKKTRYPWRFAIISILTLIMSSIIPYLFSVNKNKTFDKVHNISLLEKELKEYNKQLPMDSGFGLRMLKVELVDNSIVYIGEIPGAKPSDFTKDIIEEARVRVRESLQFGQDFKDLMRRLDLGITYKYINEYNEHLYSLKYHPNEL